MNANLRPFKKGHPGGLHTKKHPNGYFTPILKNLLNKKIDVTDEKVQAILNLKKPTKLEIRQIIMLKYAANAMSGDNTAIQGIIDRVDGKVKDRVEHSVDDETKALLNTALNRLT